MKPRDLLKYHNSFQHLHELLDKMKTISLPLAVFLIVALALIGEIRTASVNSTKGKSDDGSVTGIKDSEQNTSNDTDIDGEDDVAVPKDL